MPKHAKEHGRTDHKKDYEIYLYSSNITWIASTPRQSTTTTIKIAENNHMDQENLIFCQKSNLEKTKKVVINAQLGR